MGRGQCGSQIIDLYIIRGEGVICSQILRNIMKFLMTLF